MCARGKVSRPVCWLLWNTLKNQRLWLIHATASVAMSMTSIRKKTVAVFATGSILPRSIGGSWHRVSSSCCGVPRRRGMCFLMLPMLLYLRILLQFPLSFRLFLAWNLCGNSSFVMVSCFSSVTRPSCPCLRPYRHSLDELWSLWRADALDRFSSRCSR